MGVQVSTEMNGIGESRCHYVIVSCFRATTDTWGTGWLNTDSLTVDIVVKTMRWCGTQIPAAAAVSCQCR